MPDSRSCSAGPRLLLHSQLERVLDLDEWPTEDWQAGSENTNVVVLIDVRTQGPASLLISNMRCNMSAMQVVLEDIGAFTETVGELQIDTACAKLSTEPSFSRADSSPASWTGLVSVPSASGNHSHSAGEKPSFRGSRRMFFCRRVASRSLVVGQLREGVRRTRRSSWTGGPDFLVNKAAMAELGGNVRQGLRQHIEHCLLGIKGREDVVAQDLEVRLAPNSGCLRVVPACITQCAWVSV